MSAVLPNAQPDNSQPDNTGPMIALKDVSKSYDGRVILENINLAVQPQEILAIIGPSGCGKSTLLRLISGLEPTDSGSVSLADDNITLVFQYSALFDSLSVYENVAFSLLEKPDSPTHSRANTQRPKYHESDLRNMVRQKLELVGLDDVMDLYPNQLSGGMQKRVSFARAIINNPKIILYDEPTAGLDPIASTVIEDYIITLRRETSACSVVVTHNLSTIKRAADRVCLLFDGKIQWQGTAEDFFKTDNPYAVQFSHGALEGPMTLSHHQ